MVATEKGLKIDESFLNPLPFTNKENLIANAFRLRLLETYELTPGTTRYNQYQQMTYEFDRFLENYPAESGEVIADLDLPGLLRMTIIKP